MSKLGEHAQGVARADKPRRREQRNVSAPQGKTPSNEENPITYRFGNDVVPPGAVNETSPYGGERGTTPFTDGDKTHGWSTGVGEQQGSEQDSTK